ncbi:hypothetical protein [Fodinicola acaciae]|uniref:hypothetical protein n=1 Tax=Fodinicola acaciae TaxID=2681555 RepID=UPI0013D80A19|nr:hypothetical protein [Fodinicola acaciae]
MPPVPHYDMLDLDLELMPLTEVTTDRVASEQGRSRTTNTCNSWATSIAKCCNCS